MGQACWNARGQGWEAFCARARRKLSSLAAITGLGQNRGLQANDLPVNWFQNTCPGDARRWRRGQRHTLLGVGHRWRERGMKLGAEEHRLVRSTGMEGPGAGGRSKLVAAAGGTLENAAAAPSLGQLAGMPVEERRTQHHLGVCSGMGCPAGPVGTPDGRGGRPGAASWEIGRTRMPAWTRGCPRRWSPQHGRSLGAQGMQAWSHSSQLMRQA